jgi:hypothetical protein
MGKHILCEACQAKILIVGWVRIWGKRQVAYTKAVIVFSKCEADATSSKGAPQFFDAVIIIFCDFLPCLKLSA